MTVRYERDAARRRIVVTMQGPFVLPDFLGVISVTHLFSRRLSRNGTRRIVKEPASKGFALPR